MKKLFIFSIVAFFAMQASMAQYTTQKLTIAVGDCEGTLGELLHNSILSSIRSCRYNVVDWSTVKDSEEKNNVDYIITGAAVGFTIDASKNTGLLGKDLTGQDSMFTGKLRYTLTLTDAKKNATVAKMTSRANIGSGYTREEAKLKGAKVDPFDVEDILNEGAEVTLPITDYKLNAKGKKSVEEVVVKMESNVGICKGMYFDIMIESEEYGVKTYKKVGGAKFDRALGEQAVVLSVNKGNKDVYKYNEQEIPMVIVTRELTLLEKAGRTGINLFVDDEN